MSMQRLRIVQYIHRRWRRWLRLDIALLALLLAVALPAPAATGASGDAYGLSAQASLQPLLGTLATVNVSPVPSTSGNAPPNYSNPATAASASVTLSGLPTLVSTGVLNVNTSATLASDVSQSSATVDNVTVSVAGLINLTAGVVASQASAVCSGGSVVASGSTSLTGAGLSLLGALGVALDASPAPNTRISALGVTVTLNEQAVSGNTATVNGIRVTIANGLLTLLGTLNADIVIAHSSATLSSNCAPATAPDLALSISQPVPALQAGQVSNITVTLSNIGTGGASGPQSVSAQLPAGVVAAASFANNGWSCSNAGGSVSCANPAAIAAGGSSAFTIAVTPQASAVGTTPTITASTPVLPGETNTANNTASMTTTVAVAPAPPGGAPDLALAMSQPVPAFVAGQASAVTVTLSNVGSLAVPGPQSVAVSLPADMAAPGSFASNGWSCTTASSSVTCTQAAALAAGGSTSFAIAATPGASTVGSKPTFTATTPVQAGESNTANNTASMTASVAVGPPPAGAAPDVALAIGQPSPALTLGATSTVVVTLSNVGNAAAPGPLALSLAVPPGFDPPATFGTGGWTCATSGNAVSCNASATLAAGASTAVGLPLTPQASTLGTTPTITGNAAAVTGETNLVNNSASMTAAAVGPGAPNAAADLLLTIGAPVPPLMVGEASDIPVTLTNVGGATAPGPFTVSVVLPPFTASPATLTSGDWTCARADSTVTCGTSISLPAGVASGFAIPVTPDFGVGGQPVTTTGSTPPMPGEANTANNFAAMVTTVLGPGADENYQDLWWNPSESGWGATIMHQGNTVVIAVFDYDNAGAPTWQFLANAQRTGGNTWSGALYRMTGTPFDGRPFDPAQTKATVIGDATIEFVDPFTARLRMTMGTVVIDKEITRQSLAPLQSIEGRYATGVKSVRSNCADATANGATLSTAFVSVSVANQTFSMERVPVGEGVTCTTHGSYRQHGSLLVSLDALTTCSDGASLQGLGIMRIMNNTLVTRTWQSSATPGACSAVTTMTGVK